MPGDAERRHCAECDQAVHDIAGLSEAEVRALASDGKSRCVRLAVSPTGQLVQLDRRSRPKSAAVGVTVAVLVACAPHERPAMPEDDKPPRIPAQALVADPPPEQGATHFVMGAMRGPRAMYRVDLRVTGVQCDSLPQHVLGRAVTLEHGPTLLQDAELAAADLLAWCDP